MVSQRWSQGTTSQLSGSFLAKVIEVLWELHVAIFRPLKLNMQRKRWKILEEFLGYKTKPTGDLWGNEGKNENKSRRRWCCMPQKSSFITIVPGLLWEPQDRTSESSGNKLQYTHGLHTVWTSQIVFKKFNFWKNHKIVNLNFCVKNEWIYCDYDKLISISIWIFTSKMVKTQHFQYCWFCTYIKSRFWRENSNYPGKPSI